MLAFLIATLHACLRKLDQGILWGSLLGLLALIAYVASNTHAQVTPLTTSNFESNNGSLASPATVQNTATSSLATQGIEVEPPALSPTEEARIILERALLSAVWGPPAYCMIHQEINALGRTLHGQGKYARGDNGQGQMKLELQIVAGDRLNLIRQVSDGRRLHTRETFDTVTQERRVDLTEVRKYLVRFSPEQDCKDPLVALHLAIGGQNEKLRALCQQYNWISVQPGTFAQPGQAGDVDVWWLKGERVGWGTHKGFGILHGTAEIDMQLHLANGAGLAPERVRVAIGRKAPLQYWLYHVEETKGASEGQANSSLVARISYYQPVKENLPIAMFSYEDVYASTVEQIVDETKRYVPPPRQIAVASNATEESAVSR